MPKRPKVITEENLIAAAEHLATSEDKFAKSLDMTMDALIAMDERLRGFAQYLDKRDDYFHANVTRQDSMAETLEALIGIIAANTVAINEIRDRLDKFLTKFETYFSTDRGLEFDN